MARPPEHSGVIAALIDEELDTQKLLATVAAGGETATERLMLMVKRTIEAAASGGINKVAALRTIRMGFVGIVLLEYLNAVHEIATMTDSNVARQMGEIKKFGKPLKEIAAIRDEDVKARVTELAGVGTPDGEPS